MQRLRNIYIISLLSALSLSFSGFAQRFNFHNLNLDISSECYCVLQDSKGYIWFSSEQGLYRYNGVTTKCFNTNNGMPDNNIFQLCEDAKGRILFSTLIGKVGYIENDSVIFPPMNKRLEEEFAHGHVLVYDMYVDKDHFLWISSYSGIFRTTRPDDYSEVISIGSKCDTCDAGITLVDGTKALTARYPIKNLSQTKNAFFDFSDKLRTIRYDPDSQLVTATLRKVVKLNNGNILWGLGDCLFMVKPDGSFTKTRLSKKVLAIYQDRDGGVWIGLREDGVLFYKDATLSGLPLNSLQGYSVSSVMQDNEGGIWASTLEKGMFYAASKSVIDYTNRPGLDKKVIALSPMGNKILASNTGKGFYVISDTGVRKVDLPAKYITEGLYDYLNYKDDVYIGTTEKFIRTDTAFKKWTTIYSRYPGGRRNTPSIYGMCRYNDKLFAVNLSFFFTLTHDSAKFIDNVPGRGKAICTNENGDIYVGCSNGLYKYADGKMSYLGAKDKALSVKIYRIKEAPDSCLWLMTPAEGVIIVKQDKIIASVNDKSGLNTNNVYDVAFDSIGNAWIGTDNGISRIYCKRNYAVENFGTLNGIISGEVIKTLIRRNHLWLATGNGLCVVDIASIHRNNVPPHVYITSVFANEHLISNRSEFNYNVNNFRFAVDGLTYKDNVIRMIYRLEGADTTWHTSNSNEIAFNQLPSGNYTFEVKAINADGIASIEPAIYSFVIEKPYWLSWWFIALEILLAAIISYLFIQVRLKAIRKKEEEKTRINKIIAEYEITALRTQMNPHFIFNAINSIQHYVLQNNAREAYDYLAKFSRLIRMMLNNAQEKKLSLQQEIEMLRLYVELEQLRFSQSFRFFLHIDEEIDAQQVFVPAMLIQPYVENAIWHGLMNLKDKSNAELSLSIRQESDSLRITIKDNGVGREQAKLIQKDSTHRSVGMELTRKRTEVLSKIPGEEKVEIQIKDLYNDNKPCGTLVEILISNIIL